MVSDKSLDKLPVRRVSLKEFGDSAKKLRAAGEAVLIEEQGHPVGYFIPIKGKNEAEIAKAEARLAAALERAISESGLTQDELADLFTIKRDRAPGR